MTYKELLSYLQSLPEFQLNQTVLVYDTVNDEFKPITKIRVTPDDEDVLDPDHVYLNLED